jgi:hypothetical protein
MASTAKRKEPASAPASPPPIPLATRAADLGNEIAAAPEGERRAAIEALQNAFDAALDRRAGELKAALQNPESGAIPQGWLKMQLTNAGFGFCLCNAMTALKS